MLSDSPASSKMLHPISTNHNVFSSQYQAVKFWRLYIRTRLARIVLSRGRARNTGGHWLARKCLAFFIPAFFSFIFKSTSFCICKSYSHQSWTPSVRLSSLIMQAHFFLLMSHKSRLDRTLYKPISEKQPLSLCSKPAQYRRKPCL